MRCGCFFGTIEKFEAEVNETHKDNDKYRQEYLEAIKYISVIRLKIFNLALKGEELNELLANAILRIKDRI